MGTGKVAFAGVRRDRRAGGQHPGRPGGDEPAVRGDRAHARARDGAHPPAHRRPGGQRHARVPGPLDRRDGRGDPGRGGRGPRPDDQPAAAVRLRQQRPPHGQRVEQDAGRGSAAAPRPLLAGPRQGLRADPGRARPRRSSTRSCCRPGPTPATSCREGRRSGACWIAAARRGRVTNDGDAPVVVNARLAPATATAPRASSSSTSSTATAVSRPRRWTTTATRRSATTTSSSRPRESLTTELRPPVLVPAARAPATTSWSPLPGRRAARARRSGPAPRRARLRARAATVAAVTGCCNPRGCDEFFNPRFARRMARRYRKRGLDKPSRRMVEFLEQRTDLDGATVLEIGGGVGEIQLELLKRGAARTLNLELSNALRPGSGGARARGRRARTGSSAGSTTSRSTPDAIEPVDIVVLHRVVCCYPDYERLLGAAGDRAQAARWSSATRRATCSRARSLPPRTCLPGAPARVPHVRPSAAGDARRARATRARARVRPPRLPVADRRCGAAPERRPVTLPTAASSTA